jgi:LysR family transcriptional regulator, hydrogen peroxide-inducible genes activator
VNIQQIRYFNILCEEETFTSAARKCGIRQPSLTCAVKRLERELGGTLFVRSNPIQLTAFGVALRPYFVQIDETVERVRHCAVKITA